MASSNIKKVANENGWYKAKGIYFGTYKNYVFSMYEEEGFKTVYAESKNLTPELQEQLKHVFEAKKKELKIGEINVVDDGILIKLSESFKQVSKEKIYETMDLMAEFFRDHNIPANNNCHICKTTEQTDFYLDNNIGKIYCKKCHDENFAKYERAKIDYQSEEKFYLKGIVGAVLFSIVGVILWVVVEVYLDRMATLCAAIIAIMAFKGYLKIGAKIGPLTKWIMVAITIVMVALSNFLAIAIILLEGGLPANEIISYIMNDPDVIEALKKSIMLSGVISIFALAWIFYVVMKSEPVPKMFIAQRVA
jgi:hypothetical protein